jgi:hypothetical protein
MAAYDGDMCRSISEADEERGCSEIKRMERTDSDLTLMDEESEDITCNKSIVAR